MTADTKRTKERAIEKRNHELDNPCVKEMKASLKCIERNYSDQTKCKPYFDNYNNCNAFWNRVKRERQRKGIQPALPVVEEREQVKEEYRKAWGY